MVLPRKKIVLLLDDNKTILEGFKQELKDNGFEVKTATTSADAKDILRSCWVHLPIIDTHLLSDQGTDFEGLTLLNDPLFDIYNCFLMYTAQEVRDLNSEAFRNAKRGPLIKVIPKNKGTIADEVKQVFDLGNSGRHKVGINFDQELISDSGYVGWAFVALLKNAPIKEKEAEVYKEWAWEMESLFGRAFPNHNKLVITRPRTTLRDSDSFILIVTPYQDGNAGHSLIVKCGNEENIRNEAKNYRSHIANKLDAIALELQGEAGLLEAGLPVLTRTRHFGLLKYNIPINVNLSDLETFATYYANHDSNDIQEVIKVLFGDITQSWHTDEQNVHNINKPIFEAYEERLLSGLGASSKTFNQDEVWKLITERTEQILRQKSNLVQKKDDTLSWSVARFKRSLYNPRSYIFSNLRDKSKGDEALFVGGYPEALCHGDLHPNNILVDRNRRPWLIDFENTGWAPMLLDFIELESAIHFWLLKERNLENTLKFELLLANQEDWSKPETLVQEVTKELLVSPNLHKAAAAIATLREQASRIGSRRWRHYLLGLVYRAFRILLSEQEASFDDTRDRDFIRVQALFLASACCERLIEIEIKLANSKLTGVQKEPGTGRE